MTVATSPYSTDDLELALETPRLDLNPGARYDEPLMDSGLAEAITVTAGGRLFLAWIGGGDNELAYVLVSSSDDDGATWSTPRVVIDPSDGAEAKRRSIVVSLWVDPRGRLWMFFDQGMTYYDGRSGVWAVRCDDPDADTLEFTTPVRLWHGAALQKPTVLSSGEWVLPVSLWPRWTITDERVRETYADLDEERGARVLFSNDEGETWQIGPRVSFDDPTFDEHTVLELRDGRLWMLARTNSGPQESFSTDQGRTWSPPQDAAIRTVTARMHLQRLASGRLLLIKNGDLIDVAPESRRTMTAFLSDDDGQTWSAGLVLDDRDPVTYPDAVQLADGRIVITWDYDRKVFGDILTAVIAEDDILAGRIHSPGSRAGSIAKRAERSPGRVGVA
jgi:sialidase-1